MLAPTTARNLRDALTGAERDEFERRFGEEMAEAARTLDLTGVLEVLGVFRKIADITRRQGAEAHRRMLDQAARLERGEEISAIPGHVHKAEVAARLGQWDVYSYEIVSEASGQVEGLPLSALTYYAELIAFLELTPWEGDPYRADNPDGNMRTMPFGKQAEGLAIYVILESQLRVVVLSVTWVDWILWASPALLTVREEAPLLVLL
jgi:hypothetical protein